MFVSGVVTLSANQRSLIYGHQPQMLQRPLEYTGDSSSDLDIFLRDIASDPPKSYRCTEDRGRRA